MQVSPLLKRSGGASFGHPVALRLRRFSLQLEIPLRSMVLREGPGFSLTRSAYRRG